MSLWATAARAGESLDAAVSDPSLQGTCKGNSMLNSHQGQQSRFWERKTLSPKSPATTSVITVLHIFPIQTVVIPFIQDIRYRNSREIPFSCIPSTLPFPRFLSNYKIKNMFVLEFMCIILVILMTITTAAISTVSFTLRERNFKMVFAKVKQILRVFMEICCLYLKYQNTCSF